MEREEEGVETQISYVTTETPTQAGGRGGGRHKILVSSSSTQLTEKLYYSHRHSINGS